MKIHLIVPLFLLGLCACQQTSTELPTLAVLPTQAVALRATLPPLTEAAVTTPTTAYIVLPTATLTATPTPTEQVTLTPLLPTSTPPPTITPTLLPAEFSFGQSGQGRPLKAYRYGTGSRVILLVAGIHAGFERNTTRLLERIRQQLTSFPLEIAPTLSFIVVPLLNPDGDEMGETLAGRFNASGVDLNRNWGCDWTAEARFREMTVSAGSQPFSEAETLALGGFIQQVQPVVVLFYHAAANGVFIGHCNTVSVSETLGQVYGEAAQYPYGQAFSAYPVTGTAPNWVDSLGIPAADVELATSSDDEFVRNWNALLAVQRWLTENGG